MTHTPSPPTVADVRRVVIIDDGADDRAEVRRLLLTGSDRRYKFAEADTGAAGVRAVLDAAGGPPDCVVLDYNLPDMDAPEALAALAGPDGLPVCPVVVLTGSAGADMGRAVLRAGAQDYIGKVWLTPEGLTRAVENAAERWQMARELRASEERYRLLADALPHLTWVTRPADHSVEYANRMHVEYTGLTVEELNAVGWPSLVHPDDRDRLWAEVAGPLARGEPHEAEYRLRWHDGSYRWVLSRAVPVTDPAGRVVRWVGTTVDIDVRKRAEEDLRVRHAHAEVVSRTAARLVLRQTDGADDLAAAVFNDLAGVLGVELYFNYLVGPEPDALRLVSWAGLTAEQRGRFARIRVGEYLCGAVAATRRPVVLDHVDRADSEAAAGLRALGGRAYAGFPLLAGDAVLGTIAFATARRPAFTPDEVGLMQTACDLLAAALHRDRLAAAVADNEERLRNLVRTSPAGIAEASLDGRLTDANPAFCRLLGYDRDELIGTHYAALTHPDDLPAEAALVGRVLAGELADYRTEKRYVRKDGRVVWVDLTSSPTRHPDGSPRAGVAVVLDVTARKEAEAALRANEERLRLALEASDTGLWEWDVRTDAVAWSPECYRIHGVTGAEFDRTGAGFFRLVHPDDRGRVEATVRAAVDGRALYECEFRIIRPDGQVAWVANRGRASYDDAGQPVRVLGTITDVTARVRAERDLATELGAARRLHEVSVQLLGEDLGAVVERLLDAAVEVMGSQFASLQMFDPGRGELKLLGFRGFSPEAAAFWGWVRPASESTCGMAMRAGRRVYVADVTACEGMAGTPDLATYLGTGIRAVQTTPLLTRTGELVGMLSTHWREPHEPVERDLRGLDVLARMAADLIDHKRTQDGLARSEAFARSVVEASADCVKGLSPDGRLLWMNEAGKRLMEVCDFAALKGCDWAAFWEPGGVRAEAEAALAAARAGGVGRFRGFCPTAAGTPRWWDVAVTPIPGPDGRVEQLLSVSRDVTDARAAELALAASEQRFRLMADGLPFPVWVHDPAGRLRLVNRTYCEYFGVTAEQVLGDNWQPLVHPDDVREYAASFLAAVEERVPWSRPCRVRRAGGDEWRWVESSARPHYAPDGEYLGMVGCSPDVTDRKRAEADLLARERELQTLADNTPDILTRFDRDLRHVFVNAAVERATGRPRAEFLGKTNRDLGMPADLCDRWEAALRAVFETGQHRSIEFDYPSPAGVRYYAARLVPEFGPGGRVEHVLGVTHDVTDRKRFEQTMAEQDKRKDEFLATLAHELRNPLAPIRTGLQLLRMAGEVTGAAARARDMMERQVGHLVHLVDDLLDVSRVSQGKITLRRERVTAREAVEAAVEACRPAVDAKRHALVVDLPDEPLAVDGDRTRLVQVVANLLTNAAKYSEDGGRITVAARREGGDVVVRVTDTGVGIAAEALPTLWDMFTQVRDTLDKAQGGLGIGLSLVKKLVEMHGGGVCAESRGVGHGSTFTVRLPLAAELPPPAVPVRRNGPAAAKPAGRRVLVVDDNADGAESLAEMLNIFGHQTAVAHTGPEALAAARRFRPEVAFLDIGLPGMDGYEVARRLRGDQDTAGAVIVALTGWGSEEDRRRSAEAGFDFHLTKPVEADAVLALLGRLPAAGGAGIGH